MSTFPHYPPLQNNPSMQESVSPSKCQCSPPPQKMHWKHSEWLNLKILPRISHQTSIATMIHFLEEREKKSTQKSVSTILFFKIYYIYSNETIYHSPSKECFFIYIAGKVQLHWNSRAGVTSFKIICIKVTVKQNDQMNVKQKLALKFHEK